ncbi:50S ribosomal protein L22 [Candidatus Peregrinibacteria bacterium]|jgi:large subunit ribosomal protein L22|nr:50S ribosomal protein L22 [Candidatus Peregrinibacteria bacterium]MBT4147770.1 50S ribosomal protein L22 [Candidatus Peregrinibacteria bacterium]MBT4365919.1 50S ribosomal protein L22 [Candidatus Peregrinibacteria bacterium]MBT4456544.1 50S ribosomal protein L22 [Candidatus Peregrinibacteria bacterium]
MQAIAKHLRISPKKANLVAGLVRKKPVQDALDILQFTQKKAAPMIRKVIASAAANAKETAKQDIESLQIKEIIVNEGTTLKRSVPISRGRMHPIKKRTSHIRVYLETKKEKIKTKTPAKAETPAPAETPAEEKPKTN